MWVPHTSSLPTVGGRPNSSRQMPVSLSKKHAHAHRAGGNSATSAVISAAAQPRLVPSAARQSGRVLLPPTSSGLIFSIHIIGHGSGDFVHALRHAANSLGLIW
jgi:hypothetical protein